MYWKTTGWMVTRVREIMSRDRFYMIWRFLHLSNSAKKDDKLCKVRPYVSLSPFNPDDTASKCHLTDLYDDETSEDENSARI